MKLRCSLSLILVFISSLVSAQTRPNASYLSYVKKYKSTAILEMQLYKIPASIILAQGIIESGSGNSTLAVASNNHFGIKCQREWIGDTYYYDDDTKNECFRKYNNVDESYRDHSIFLSTRSRYAFLFLLPITDYKGWANGLKQAGYATNPDYANILIRIIETCQLYLLDDASLFDENLLLANETGVKKKFPEKEDSDNNGSLPSDGRILFRKNYKMPQASDFEYAYTSELGRKVFFNYYVPFIIARSGDTWYSIAKEFRIFAFQVYKQNDLRASDPVTPGQMIYLEHKKRKNPEHTYIVKKGDSMYSISQDKCIKLSLLLKYNKLKIGFELLPGYKLKLKR